MVWFYAATVIYKKKQFTDTSDHKVPSPSFNSEKELVSLKQIILNTIFTTLQFNNRLNIIRNASYEWYYVIQEEYHTSYIWLQKLKLLLIKCYSFYPGPLLLTWFNFNPSMDK